MTLMGKIFTLLIFIMSLVFMSFAVMVFATHKNWKEAALNSDLSGNKKLGLKPQLEQAYAQRRALENELEVYKTQLAEHQAARRQALAVLQTKVEEVMGELTRTQDQLNTLTTAHTAAVETLKVQETNLKKAETEVAGLRTDIVTIQQDRDDKFNRVVTLTDQIHQAQGKLIQLEERKQQLITQVAEQKKVMEKFNITVNTPLEAIPPEVDGVVTDVNMTTGLVEISVGLDDGLREGHTLEVYNGSKYLGRIVLRKVTPNRSVGEIDRKYLKGTIRKEDRVGTKIN